MGNTAKQLHRIKTLVTYKHLLWLLGLIRLNLTNSTWTNWKQFLSVPRSCTLISVGCRCVECDTLGAILLAWEIKGKWEGIFRVFWGLCISEPTAMKFEGKKSQALLSINLLILSKTLRLSPELMFWPRHLCQGTAPEISRCLLAAFWKSEYRMCP